MDIIEGEIAANVVYLRQRWSDIIANTEVRLRHARMWGEEAFFRFLHWVAHEATLAGYLSQVVATIYHVFADTEHPRADLLQRWFLATPAIDEWIYLIAEVGTLVGHRGIFWIQAYLELVPITYTEGQLVRDRARNGLPKRPTLEAVGALVASY